MGVYLKWFNQTLKNYYSTNEMKLSGGGQLNLQKLLQSF